MKVTVSVRGKFHAFHLAHQLHRRGHLDRLITSYPAFTLDEYGVPRDRVSALPVHEVASRFWNHFPQAVQRHVDLQPAFHDAFDRQASRHIPTDTDLYVGWSGFSEHGLQHARQLGAVTVVERGSTHIEYQRDLLLQEGEMWGVRTELPHPAVVEKEIREYQLADFISVPSTFARGSFLSKGFPPHRILLAPYGADVRMFRPTTPRHDIFRVIYTGTLSLRKGVHYLLQAFSELRLPNSELWLVGHAKPEILPFLRRYDGSFRHLAAVPQGELPSLYARASVFAICSIEEGQALVITQALACGLPVICTTNSGGGDIIRDGVDGYVVPVRDIPILKERLLHLYATPHERLAMGQSARDRAVTSLTWDDYGSQIMRQYSAALANNSNPRGVAGP